MVAYVDILELRKEFNLPPPISAGSTVPDDARLNRNDIKMVTYVDILEPRKEFDLPCPISAGSTVPDDSKDSIVMMDNENDISAEKLVNQHTAGLSGTVVHPPLQKNVLRQRGNFEELFPKTIETIVDKVTYKLGANVAVKANTHRKAIGRWKLGLPSGPSFWLS